MAFLSDVGNILSKQPRKVLGGAVGTIGTLFGGPEMNWSERIAGTYQPKTSQAATPSRSTSSIPEFNPVGDTGGAGIRIVNDGDVLGMNNYSGGGSGAGKNTTTTNPTASDFGAPSAGDFNAAIDEIYNPAMERLNSLYGQLESQQPLALQQLQTSYNQSLLPLDERLTQGQADIQSQQQDVRTGEMDAMSQARRLYNELTQNTIARYGAGSSAGPAISEIIGREVSNQMGNARNIAGQAYQKLTTDARNLSDFIGRQKEVLGQKLADAQETIRAEFRARAAEIDAQRGALAQSKSEQKLAELQRARERAFQLQDQADAFARQLTMFENEKAAELASRYNVNQGISTEALNAFRQLAPVVGTEAAAGLAGVDLSSVRGVTAPFGTGGYRELPDGRLMDIYTGEVVDPAFM